MIVPAGLVNCGMNTDILGTFYKTLIVIWKSITVVLLIASCTGEKAADEDRVTDQGDSIKKEQISDFWSSYRMATKQRVEGDFKAAINSYRQALAVNGQHEDAIYYLGNMYLELEQYDEAEKAWEELLLVNPQSSRAHYQLGNLYMQWETSEYFDLDYAENEFKKVLEINSDFLQPILLLGQISLMKGKIQEALNHFSTVIVSHDRSIEAHLLSAYIFWLQHDDNKAFSSFATAVQYSVEENEKKSHSGEGDTRGGISLERSLSRSVFTEIIKDLPGAGQESDAEEMKTVFKKIENLLAEIKKKGDR